MASDQCSLVPLPRHVLSISCLRRRHYNEENSQSQVSGVPKNEFINLILRRSLRRAAKCCVSIPNLRGTFCLENGRCNIFYHQHVYTVKNVTRFCLNRETEKIGLVLHNRRDSSYVKVLARSMHTYYRVRYSSYVEKDIVVFSESYRTCSFIWTDSGLN